MSDIKSVILAVRSLSVYLKFNLLDPFIWFSVHSDLIAQCFLHRKSDFI